MSKNDSKASAKNPQKSSAKKSKVLTQMNIDGIVEYIKSGKCKNVITMAGAGISTSSGIPDFRSADLGLYDKVRLYMKLWSYNLPNPEAVFDIDYFRQNPEPFFIVARELLGKTYEPTPCHHFIRLLSDKNLLLRHYTQNVDGLERQAGLAKDKIVEAHGTIHTSHCLKCSKEYSFDWMKEKISVDLVPRCEHCKSVVKPDVVLFGDCLPERAIRTAKKDLPRCDLLIILGTSLTVEPFASVVDQVPSKCPRLLINLEEPESLRLKFHSADDFRDVTWIGDCDAACRLLADKLGWTQDLNALIDGGSVDAK